MPQEKLQTMVMQTFWGAIEVYYGIVQVVNTSPSVYNNMFRGPILKDSKSISSD